MVLGPGKMLAGIGALGLFALFSSKAASAAPLAQNPEPKTQNPSFKTLCGVGLCLYVQEVRPGYFEAFADRNLTGDLYPSIDMAVQTAEMPLVSFSVTGGKRKLVTFDPNSPDYVELASKMLGV